jgi:hypothetical protein
MKDIEFLVLKWPAGEKWGMSVGIIVSEIEKYYVGPRRNGMSYIQ